MTAAHAGYSGRASRYKFIGYAGVEIVRSMPRGGIAEIGYLLLPEFWNRGHGTALCARLIDYCFNRLGLHKVIAACNENNTGSWTVLEKSGMTREGRFIEKRRLC